ncbi:hypothetical protein G6F22_010623 [Rhizopus arrhizus]|nr:hypothetical protein G6F22_010623 [Rhizopus arrhizus]
MYNGTPGGRGGKMGGLPPPASSKRASRDIDQAGRPHPVHRRRAAVHLVLPPGRLHQEPCRRLRARGVAGREGGDGPDPDQLADVRRRPPSDLPGHRHRHRVPGTRHGRALGRRHHGRGGHGQ